jgi:hypothetical protein
MHQLTTIICLGTALAGHHLLLFSRGSDLLLSRRLVDLVVFSRGGDLLLSRRLVDLVVVVGRQRLLLLLVVRAETLRRSDSAQ